MKKTTAVLCVLVSLLLLPGNLRPQDKLVLTLEESLKLALEQNPLYLAAKAKEEGASALVKQAVSSLMPALNAQATDILDKKVFSVELPSLYPGIPAQSFKLDFTRTYQMSLNLQVPIYVGGRLVSGYKQAGYNLEATRESIRQTRQDVIYNVKRAFYGVLLARKFVGVSEEAVALAEKHLKNVQSMFDVGMASKFDLLRAEVQAANLKPQLIRSRNGLSTAELGLKNLLGIDLKRPVEIQGELSFRESAADADAATAEALVNRPELGQLKFQRMIADEMLKSAKAAYLPSLGVGGQMTYWSNKFSFASGNWENYYSINLVLSIPIFNGFVNSARVGQTQAALKQLDYSQKGLAEMVKLEVQQAILALRQARESLLSQEKNVEEAREAVRIAELNFGEGIATSLDVNSVQVALTQALTNYTQALFDCALAAADLEKAVGTAGDPVAGAGRPKP
jgi:outer membrane protein TolC